MSRRTFATSPRVSSNTPGPSVRAIVGDEAAIASRKGRRRLSVAVFLGSSLCRARRLRCRWPASCGRDAPWLTPPDVMHFHSRIRGASWSGLRRARRPTVRHLSHRHRPPETDARRVPPVHRARASTSVDLIIASSAQPAGATRSSSRRVPTSVRVVNFGLHVERISGHTEGARAAKTAVRARHPGRPIVLFVGVSSTTRASTCWCGRMADVDAELVIMGSGPLEGELREIAVAHGVADRVTWLRSPIDDSDWPRATTPPMCSRCPALLAARRSGSCRSKRMPQASRRFRPT